VDARVSAVLLSLWAAAACSGPEPQYLGGPHYFRKIQSGSFPWRPVQPMPHDEALERAGSCQRHVVAYFDAEGRVVRVEYRTGRDLLQLAEYTYDGASAKELPKRPIELDRRECKSEQT
jgi:hypothetical protein